MKKNEIDYSKTTPVQCGTCKNETFLEVKIVRKISKLLAAKTEDVLTILPVLQCLNCGTILDEMLPDALRKPKEIAPGLRMK